jgi:hypothetical protein
MKMDGLARQRQIDESGVFAAEVKSMLSGKYLLADKLGRTVAAGRAASCLMTPTMGDRVLAVHVDDRDYILAVLEKRNSNTSEISVEGDVTLSFPSGKLDIAAKEGMSLRTVKDLSLIAGSLGVSAASLLAAFQNIELFGDAVEAHLLNIKLFSKRLESKVENAVQQFISRHTKVEGLDSLNADSIKQTAKNLLSFQSLFAFIKAKKNVKIDGKQIFMG